MGIEQKVEFVRPLYEMGEEAAARTIWTDEIHVRFFWFLREREREKSSS